MCEEKKKCYFCEEEYETLFVGKYHGEIIHFCEDCDEMLCRCENPNCNEFIEYDYAECFDGQYFCSFDCATEYGYVKCNTCGTWVYSESWNVYYDPYGNAYCCIDCIEDAGYYYCEGCEEYRADTEYYEEADRYYCENCADYYEANTGVHDYHYCSNGGIYHFEKMNIDPKFLPYLGVEWEMENGKNLSGFVEKFKERFTESQYMLCKDCSLHDDSVEIISAPVDIYEHMRLTPIISDLGLNVGGFDSACLEEHGHDCGVHVNISFDGMDSHELQVLGVKMLELMVRFEPTWKRLCRREKFTYCDFDRAEETFYALSRKIDFSYDTYADEICRRCRHHSSVVNLTHCDDYKASRVELRLFGGTMDTEELLFSVCFAQALAMVCRTASEIFIKTCTYDQLKEEMLKTTSFVCADVHKILKEGLEKNAWL